MSIECNEKILLTGAGFTHNFGTPLVSGMSAMLISDKRIQSYPKVRHIFLNSFDYESNYYEIMEGSCTSEEKDAVHNAMVAAYDRIDSIVRDYKFTKEAPYPINIYEVQKLINQFSVTDKKGFVFTTNQDLFMERHYYNGERLFIPGIKNQKWFSSLFTEPIKPSEYCQLPTRDELEANKDKYFSGSKFFYIKLHGSQNWKDSSGSPLMVIGRGKKEQIENEPLLAWYFDVFKSALCQPNRKLLVIGYGFGDDHINKIVAEAVKNHNLKIYIISPAPISTTSEGMMIGNLNDIWQGLSGYIDHTLLEIFPENQSITQANRDIYDILFDIKS